MYLKISGIAILFMLCSCLSYSNNKKSHGCYSIDVKVCGLRNSKGEIIFLLYNKEGSIPDEHFKKFLKKEKAKIINGAAEFVFKNLPAGRYAVSILHDENKNGKIDKGFILPTEGVGFSHYTSISLTNRPNFNKASFYLDKDIIEDIKIIYF